MTEPLILRTVRCPRCWQRIELVIDVPAGDQCYVEDCQICCQPMHVAIQIDAAGEPQIEVGPAD